MPLSHLPTYLPHRGLGLLYTIVHGLLKPAEILFGLTSCRLTKSVSGFNKNQPVALAIVWQRDGKYPTM